MTTEVTHSVPSFPHTGSQTKSPGVIGGMRSIQSYSSKSKHKGKLSKEMIGQPQDFRHISHVGWDPDSGFNLDKVNDKDLEEFFRKVLFMIIYYSRYLKYCNFLNFIVLLFLCISNIFNIFIW